MSRRSRQPGAVPMLVVIAVVIAGAVYALAQPNWTERSIARVEGGAESSELLVTVNHNRCGNGGLRVRVTTQSADAVVLRAEQNVRGDCEDIGLTSVITVDLQAPLGQRSILFEPEDLSDSVVCAIDGKVADQCR